MKQINSIANSERIRYAETSNSQNTWRNKDDFQRAIYRKPLQKFSTKNRTSLVSEEYPVSSNLSDTCNMTHTEADDVVDVARWLQTLSHSKLRSIDNEIFHSNKKSVRAPKVTFNRTLYVEPDKGVRFCMNKRSLREETNSIPTKRGRLSKNRNDLKQNNSMKGKNIHAQRESRKYSKKLEKKRTPRNYERQALLKESFLKDFLNNKILPTSSGDQNTFRGIKQSCSSSRSLSSREAKTKKRMMMRNKIVQNRRLLKTMEDVIYAMNKDGEDFSFHLNVRISQNNGLRSVESNRFQWKKYDDQGQGSINNTKNQVNEMMDIRRPIFEQPKVEQYLNDSMDIALRKYRKVPTWDKVKKDSFIFPNYSTKRNSVALLST